MFLFFLLVFITCSLTVLKRQTYNYLKKDARNTILIDNNLICKKEIVQFNYFIKNEAIRYCLDVRVSTHERQRYELIFSIVLTDKQWEDLIIKVNSCAINYLSIPFGIMENAFLESGYLSAIKDGSYNGIYGKLTEYVRKKIFKNRKST